jgi:DNA polymerase III epsilon subunit-like protein
MTVLVLFDTETTGLNPEVDEICQFAAVVHRDSDPESVTLSFETLCDPGKPISLESTAIHGITDEMVRGKPSAKEVVQEWAKEVDEFAGDEPIVLGGHNTGFDWKFTTKHVDLDDAVQSLCTMRMGRRMAPTAANHKLEFLYREHYRMSSDRTAKAHDALCDVWMSFELLRYWMKLLQKTDYSEVSAELSAPIELLIMPFGKHKDAYFTSLPKHYLQWIVKQGDSIDMDVRHTANLLLSRGAAYG